MVQWRSLLIEQVCLIAMETTWRIEKDSGSSVIVGLVSVTGLRKNLKMHFRNLKKAFVTQIRRQHLLTRYAPGIHQVVDHDRADDIMDARDVT